MGYTYIQCGSAEWFIPIEELEYLVTYPTSGYYQGCNGYWYKDDFDCGTNEELFLALAALRDDTDKNQYCIDSEGNWFLYNKTYIRLLSKTDINWYKATVKEIIEYFKTK